MSEDRILDAKKKGEVVYDYEHDVLLFKIKDREYDFSIEQHNFAIDIDKEEFVTGIRIFDASKMFNIRPMALRDIPHFEFKAKIEQNILTVEFKFIARMRNKLQKIEEHPVNQRITESMSEPLPEMTVTAAA